MENTHEVYVNLETAKLLKKAGFNWECHASYQNGKFTEFQCSSYFKVLIMDFNSAPDYMNQYSAPTLDVVQRWLREVKDCDIFGYRNEPVDKFECVISNSDYWESTSMIYNTYEEAVEFGIQKRLKELLNED